MLPLLVVVVVVIELLHFTSINVMSGVNGLRCSYSFGVARRQGWFTRLLHSETGAGPRLIAACTLFSSRSRSGKTYVLSS